jgi:flagellar protein FlbD
MILLTRFNGSPILINEELIETCEETPDTVVSLHNGHKYFVKEKIGEILSLSIDFKRSCNGNPPLSEAERTAIYKAAGVADLSSGGTN